MNRVKKSLLYTVQLLLIGIISANLCACCTQPKTSKLTSYRQPYFKSMKSSSKGQGQIWGRLRNNFNLPNGKDSSNHQRVNKYVKHYARQEKTIQKLTHQASPYLYYIVEQLEKRNMPGELALLPMIESEFKPQATSHRGAAGLWQFIPGTGRYCGLKQDAWYDGRRDVKASTNAALDYLAYLYEEFNHNWILALAAYNAGEGTIQRAIKRNISRGLPTHFCALDIPKETREYVPKFLALAKIMANPEKYDITLPTIEDKPYFTHVNPGKHLTFVQVAKLADLNLAEVQRLNPGYRKLSTHPTGPQELLLPVANAHKFEYNLTQKR